MFIIIFLSLIFRSEIFAETVSSALIAAVVNQHAITEHELNSRIDFAIATLNMPKTKESRESMQHQVLQSLITEKLQETTGENIKITDKDVTNSLENMAKENGMTLDLMKEKFKSMGINIETLKSRIRAQICWSRLIRQMFVSQVKITENDVKKELERIKKELDTDQFELVEIVLPIDEKAKTKSKQDAERLYTQLNQPLTNFRLVAQQFGAQSGYVGWKSVKQMDKSYADTVASMPVGNITKPIEDKNTYRIIKLLDKRLSGKGSYKSRKVSTAAVKINLPEPTQENMEILEEMVTELKSAKGCGALQKSASQMPVELSISEKQPLGAMPEAMQIILDKASVGEIVGPIQHEDTLNMFMICSVEEAEKEKIPSEKEIKEELEQKEFSKHATRFLNKILATARITIIDRADNKASGKEKLKDKK